MKLLSTTAIIAAAAITINWWTNLSPFSQDAIIEQCWPLLMLLSVIFFAWILRSNK